DVPDHGDLRRRRVLETTHIVDLIAGHGARGRIADVDVGQRLAVARRADEKEAGLRGSGAEHVLFVAGRQPDLHAGPGAAVGPGRQVVLAADDDVADAGRAAAGGEVLDLRP